MNMTCMLKVQIFLREINVNHVGSNKFDKNSIH